MTKQKHAMRIVLSILALVVLLNSHSYAADTEKDLLEKGITLAQKGSNDEAIAEFTKAIALNSSAFGAYYNRGFLYYKEAKLDEAISDLSKAIAIDIASVDAYYNRGLAYYKKGSYDAAIADYNKVLELSPVATDALYSRGLAYYKKNRIKEAIADYDAVIAMRPDFPLVYSARAVAYFSKKDYSRTLADVNTAVALGFRSRPLKQVSTKDMAETEIAVEKSQPTQLTRDPKKLAAWKARRRMTRLSFYVLYGSLIACLAVILALLMHIRRVKSVCK